MTLLLAMLLLAEPAPDPRALAARADVGACIGMCHRLHPVGDKACSDMPAKHPCYKSLRACVKQCSPPVEKPKKKPKRKGAK